MACVRRRRLKLNGSNRSRSSFDNVTRPSEAIELNPSLAFAHVVLGATYGYGGMSDDGLNHCGIAARLSPRGFTQTVNFSARGLCHFMAGRFAVAADWERRAVDLRPHFGSAWRTLSAPAGKDGNHDLAARALSEAMRLHPSLSIEWIEKYHPIVHETNRRVYIAGPFSSLNFDGRAGIPENGNV
jgi:adenylate cyclase